MGLQNRCIICNALGEWDHYAVLKYRTGKVVQCDVQHRKVCDDCYPAWTGSFLLVDIVEIRSVNKQRKEEGIAAVRAYNEEHQSYA